MLKCYTTISKDTWKIEGFTFSIPQPCFTIDSTCSNKAIITHWKINKWLYLWRGQTYSSLSNCKHTGTLCRLCTRIRVNVCLIFLFRFVLLLFSLPHCIWYLLWVFFSPAHLFVSYIFSDPILLFIKHLNFNIARVISSPLFLHLPPRPMKLLFPYSMSTFDTS